MPEFVNSSVWSPAGTSDALGEEVEEALSDLRSGHRWDRRALLTEGAFRHWLRVAKATRIGRGLPEQVQAAARVTCK